jgi:nucleoside-diphosphate-sugar epimerase/predicted dehydrogenase
MGSQLHSQISFVILGGGSVTAEYYLPAMTRMGRLADVTVVDPVQQSVAALTSRYPDLTCIEQDHCSFMANIKAVPARTSVIVALPNQFHVDAVRLALERGHHVLCEKPLALKADECAFLRALAEDKRSVLKIAMSRRYLPVLMLARQILDTKELGIVQTVEVHDCMPFLWRPQSFAFFARESGGILADMGVHYLDYLDTLIGPMTPVAYSDDARGGTESSLKYRLAAGKVRIDMRLSRIDQSGGFLRIKCDGGEIKVDKTNETELTVTPCGSKTRRIRLEQPFDSAAWPNSFHGSFCQMIADFEREVSGIKTPIADVADAQRTVALIEWAYDHRTTRTVAAQATSAGRSNVVVTGGSGFIGGHLLARLSRDSNDIRAAVRSPSSCANIARYPVEITPTDLLDMASVRALVAGARTVYHLAYGKESGSAARVTVDGTKNLVRAAIEASVDCIVILSTMYVYGFPESDRPVDETFPYRPYGGEYGITKATMERWCLEQARNSGCTRIVILNPTCVFGPGGGAYTTLPVDMVKLGTFCWISEGRGLCNYNYVDNLIDAILVAAKVPEAHGERFIINDGVISWREFIEPLVRPLRTDIPSFTTAELQNLPRHGGPFKVKDLISAVLTAPEVRGVAKRSPTIRKIFDLSKRAGPMGATGRASTPPTLSDRAEQATDQPPDWLGPLFNPEQVTFSASKAAHILKWAPKVGLAEAQAVTIAWLVETGRLPAPATSLSSLTTKRAQL